MASDVHIQAWRLHTHRAFRGAGIQFRVPQQQLMCPGLHDLQYVYVRERESDYLGGNRAGRLQGGAGSHTRSLCSERLTREKEEAAATTSSPPHANTCTHAYTGTHAQRLAAHDCLQTLVASAATSGSSMSSTILFHSSCMLARVFPHKSCGRGGDSVCSSLSAHVVGISGHVL